MNILFLCDVCDLCLHVLWLPLLIPRRGWQVFSKTIRDTVGFKSVITIDLYFRKNNNCIKEVNFMSRPI